MEVNLGYTKEEESGIRSLHLQEGRRNKKNPCGLGREGPQECSPEKRKKGPFLPGPFVLTKAWSSESLDKSSSEHGIESGTEHILQTSVHWFYYEQNDDIDRSYKVTVGLQLNVYVESFNYSSHVATLSTVSTAINIVARSIEVKVKEARKKTDQEQGILLHKASDTEEGLCHSSTSCHDTVIVRATDICVKMLYIQQRTTGIHVSQQKTGC